MKWTPRGDHQWFSADGRGRVARYDRAGDPPYFAMWYRVVPGRGTWLQVTTANGRATFRRSLPAACEAVQATVERLNRMEAKEAA